MTTRRLPLYPEIVVDMSETNGNIWNMVNFCALAAKEKNLDQEKINEFMLEAMYTTRPSKVFAICEKWFTIK